MHLMPINLCKIIPMCMICSYLLKTERVRDISNDYISSHQMYADRQLDLSIFNIYAACTECIKCVITGQKDEDNIYMCKYSYLYIVHWTAFFLCVQYGCLQSQKQIRIRRQKQSTNTKTKPKYKYKDHN